MAEPDLLPCPGCNGASVRVIGGPGTKSGPQYWAGCDHCRWRTWGNTESEAIAAWNTRAAAVAAWNMRTTDANLAALQAENERLRAEVAELKRRLEREDLDHGRTIDQRDAAEDALGRMFQAVTGRPAEWSSAWGYVDAIEEVEEHVAALEAAREDAERLDWLDSMNAKLNSHYGTTYRWKLVLSPNVVRLMSGAGGNGHAAAIDLHDSEAHGTFTCREAIDQARGKGVKA